MPKKTVKTKKSVKKNKVTKATKKTKVSKKVTPPVVLAPPVAEMQKGLDKVAAAPPAPPPAPVKTDADKIWDEIKGLQIQMFGLPNQFVSMHCTPVLVEPSRLYVTVRSTAALPSLEAAIAPRFTVELADKFVIIERAKKK